MPRIKGDTPTGESAVVADASPGSTRYTIDMDVHPDVADVALKHACQLSRFLEHHPISAHTEQAYAVATKFVREFYLSRQGSGNGQTGFGQLRDRGEKKEREQGGQEERGGGGGKAVRQLLPQPLPVVLDAGCGTGRSSMLLAESHPHLPVLGIDRSAVRLSKGHGRANRDDKANHGPLPRGPSDGEDLLTERENREQAVDGVIDDAFGGGVRRAVLTREGPSGDGGSDGEKREGQRRRGERRRGNPPPENLLLLRADLVDMWILASRDDAWKVEEHSILYPNPYPKRSQLRSRWHGHPVFPVLLSLGGRITLRSNWKPYLEEVCQAVLAISAGNQEREAAGGGARGGGAAVESLLGVHEGGVLSTNGDGAGTGGAASGAATAAAAATAPTTATTGTAGIGALLRFGRRGGENETPAERGDDAGAAAGRHAGKSFAKGQGAKPRGQGLSMAPRWPAITSGREVKAKLAGSSSIRSSNDNSGALVGGGGVGAADAASEVPATIAATAASYETSARAGPSLYVPVVPATNFEAKYKAVGETVYELRLEPR